MDAVEDLHVAWVRVKCVLHAASCRVVLTTCTTCRLMWHFGVSLTLKLRFWPFWESMVTWCMRDRARCPPTLLLPSQSPMMASRSMCQHDEHSWIQPRYFHSSCLSLHCDAGFQLYTEFSVSTLFFWHTIFLLILTFAIFRTFCSYSAVACFVTHDMALVVS